ncbi:MAG TPA: nitronate monooxygenase [Anaeromyxobacteraceae bacterium]|nr:nitronate monooxygenase [Anaeromyxobacteraceae bacterium]
MWPTTLIELCRIEHPIVLAPLAGGPGTPELAAAVCEAGGLGSLGGGYLEPSALRAEIRKLRALTRRPFLVNLFAHAPSKAPFASSEETARAQAFVAPFRAEVGLSKAPAGFAPPSFREQLAIVLDESVPVFSVTSGALDREDVQALRRQGTVVFGTATTLCEASVLAESGVQAVVVQSSEAGGHRATFTAPAEKALVGMMALLPRVADAVKIPLVAAGAIMDGRGIAAALALGAHGVQLGTAFLACPESGASPAYKAAVLAARGEGDPTVLTSAFSGRLARALSNRFSEAAAGGPVLPYPQQHGLTAEMRQAAARAGRADLLSLWAGQAVGLARSLPAGELIRELVRETRATIGRLHGQSP